MINKTARPRNTLVAGSWAAKKPDSVIIMVGKSELIKAGHIEVEGTRLPFRLSVSIEGFSGNVAKIIEMLALSQPGVDPMDLERWNNELATTFYNRYPRRKGQSAELDISRQLGVRLTLKLRNILNNTEGLPQAGEFRVIANQ